MPKRSKLETELSRQFSLVKLPAPVEELVFHPSRKWRFDFAWPDLMLAVEVEGGNYSGGRHTRGKGFEYDCIKYGAAMELGWNIYRCTGGLIKSGVALNTIEKLIALKQKKTT